MERVTRAFVFHEELATQDEGASLEEALEHVLWCVPFFAQQLQTVVVSTVEPLRCRAPSRRAMVVNRRGGERERY